MSLDVKLSIEDIIEQIKNYENQLVVTENAIQQIKGAIAACKHQMTFLVNKQNEIEKPKQPEQPEQSELPQGE